MAQSDKEVLNLYQLIGAPLLAVVQAEAQAAQVSAQFIRQIGFTQKPTEAGATPSASEIPPHRDLEEGGNFGDLKMIQFRHQVRGADGSSRLHEMNVPVLSLFPIPLLQVKDAEFDFAIRILDHEQRGAQLPAASPAKKAVVDDREEFLSKSRVELKGTIAGRQAPSSLQRSTEMQLNVKIRMEQADMPVGLAKLLAALDQGIASTPAAEGPAGPGGATPDGTAR